MKKNTHYTSPDIEQMGELFTQFMHDIMDITDEYAEKNNLPTDTIDKYINQWMKEKQ